MCACFIFCILIDRDRLIWWLWIRRGGVFCGGFGRGLFILDFLYNTLKHVSYLWSTIQTASSTFLYISYLQISNASCIISNGDQISMSQGQVSIRVYSMYRPVGRNVCEKHPYSHILEIATRCRKVCERDHFSKSVRSGKTRGPGHAHSRRGPTSKPCTDWTDLSIT